MIAFDDAQALIAEAVVALGTEQVALAEATGRVLGERLCAPDDSPRCAVSAMDGYAVADATTRAGETLRVIGESRAGAGFAGKVGPGEAVRIFTGAPIPDGTDRCVIQEHARRDGDAVVFTPGFGPATHIRPRGNDFRKGDVLLEAGTRLTPAAMVGAAAADRAAIVVARRPTIAVIGTGDELAPPGSASATDQTIPESVSFGVAAMARLWGAEVAARRLGRDDLVALSHVAGECLALADVVVVTGGASVGERDFAKPMFADHGLEPLFSKVAIKPGKPVWMGRAAGRWVVGLPGNPTSAMVTARLFLVPLLARLQGLAMAEAITWRSMPLAAPVPQTGDRETFVRAYWDEAGLIPVSNQDSGAQAALARADWLIRCPAGQPALLPCDTVTAVAF